GSPGDVTEIPRSFASAIQSEVAWREVLRDFTEPAIWIAPPNSSSFSVSVVLPASGCEMIANVRRRAASVETSGMGEGAVRRWVGREAGNYTGPAGGGRPGPAAARLQRGSVGQPRMRQPLHPHHRQPVQQRPGQHRAATG